MRPLPSIVLCLLAAGVGGCQDDRRDPPAEPGPAREAGAASHFALERVASGLVRPTYVGAAPGDRSALYVLEQPGRLMRLGPGGRARTLIDLRDEVITGAEQGLLGLAFHPGFARNRRLYLHWTDRRGDTRVVEFSLADRASPAAAAVPRPAGGEPQRRPARLRPRRPAVSRPGRWRRRLRSPPQCAGRRGSTGQAGVRRRGCPGAAALAGGADRATQPLALLVRHGSERRVDRRRGPGQLRGGQPGRTRARRAAQEPRVAGLRGRRGA